jgi:hypothetical protein
MNSTVNIGHQTSLAKLLAKENIQVRTGNFRTAYFDVNNRILGLPIMKDLDKSAYDLFVGHEVGHAIFTPVDAFSKLPEGIPFDTLNVIEDIRIERLIQNSYPGLGECFRQGYRQLWSQNFFGTTEKDFHKLNRLDRLNIRAKMRGVIDFKLSAEEETFYQKCLAAESIEQVLELCKEIYELVKKDAEKAESESQPKKDNSDETQMPSNNDSDETQMPSNNDSDETASANSSGNTSAEDDSKENSEDSGKSSSMASSSEESTTESKSSEQNKTPVDSDPTSSKDKNAKGNSNTDKAQPSEPIRKFISEELLSKTASALKDALNTKVSYDTDTRSLIEPLKKRIDSCIIPYSKVSESRRAKEKNSFFMNAPQFIQAKQEFSRKAKSHVSILTREFEMRRKAFQYSRSKESKSGSLNMERLHSYKYSEDIFRSVTLLANSKNHGMVMFIDFSESMEPNISSVLEQTIYLSLFCRAVSIPFVVYGFTSPNGVSYDDLTKIYSEMANDEIILSGGIHLVEQLNSTMSKGEFLNAVNELYAIAYYSNSNNRRGFIWAESAFGRNSVCGIYDSLRSTPLLECVIAAHHIVNRFKNTNALQKCSVIFLTDGDGMRLNINHKYDGSCDVSRYSAKYFQFSLNGKSIKLSASDYRNQYSCLIKNLRETTGSSVIGFFICSKYAIKNYIYTNVKDRKVCDKLISEARKNSYAIASDGIISSYDAMFIIPEITSSNEDFSVKLDDEDRNEAGFTSNRSVNKIANAFIDTAHEKKRSRIILQSFAEIIS